jgi:hypothetical protein
LRRITDLIKAQRIAYPGASRVSALPFETTVSFGDDNMKYSTTPALLKTVAAIAVPTAAPTTMVNVTSTPTKSGPPIATFTGAGSNVFAGPGLALLIAVSIALFLF